MLPQLLMLGAMGGMSLLWQEDFKGALDWHSPQGLEAVEVARVYRVKSQEGSFLRARHDGRENGEQDPAPAIHFGKVFDRPVPLAWVGALRWRWRVHAHPKVEPKKPWKDLAASVYVVIEKPGMLFGGKGFKFGWLAHPGPKGTRQRGLIQIGLRSGGPAGQWRWEEVDLCALYQRHYGPCIGKSIQYIGIVSDADNTDSVAAADYDGFQLLEQTQARH